MSAKKHQPYVPITVQMTEFTFRAVAVGIVLTLILGAANAYLGLRAGITVAATYPAAVVGMAILRLWRASILEENICRTAGSIGESVAAGAIFTLPAFVIARAWPSFSVADAYWKSTALMMVGSIIGVLFISLVRRVMVEDPELPFPESTAAAEIHKAGRRGAEAVKFLFYNIAIGGVAYLAGKFNLYAPEHRFQDIAIGTLGTSRVRLSATDPNQAASVGGFTSLSGPEVSPAYIGVGYIIGPKLAALNFAGGVMAWGVFVPLLVYFMGPQLQTLFPADTPTQSWDQMSGAIWRYIVRPIAVGGMLVGAAFTMFRMRKSLKEGLRRAVGEVRGQGGTEEVGRTEQYMSSKVVFALIGVMFAAMIALYVYLSGNVTAGLIAALVMLIVGFVFATVSGSLVGLIGSTNNPISGITLSTLLIAALLMVALGATGMSGVAVVLGVAAVVCVSSAVAGELLQDFKVGYILGGTPRTIQIVELIAVVVASALMFFPLWLLNEGDLRAGGTGFGGTALAAPQAGLMAMLAEGIVGGDMAWPLVVAGMLMGVVMIMAQVRSPMLVAVGMYLPFQTTFAIFVGGIIRWIADSMATKRRYNDAQKARVENAGVLTASGLIAGEALLGLVWSGMQFLPAGTIPNFGNESYLLGMGVMGVLTLVLILLPLRNAGSPDEPAPPTAMM
ncbi:MAG: oligopeptide transporter, OPT family [Acidimicrobiia bacterium]|nr:oligopeptide transporter, OPT family [Acidimicrobiia bacterium]